MKRIVIALGLTLLTLPAPATAAGLAEAMELEHARANARAGGPLTERDAELLERHGCLSGTDHPFCRQLSGERPRVRQKRRYRN